MLPRPLLRTALISAALLLLSSCGGSDGPSGPDPSEVASVAVSPGSATVDIGETVQLSASARNAMGGSVTASFTWTSSAPGVASVNASGLVTGVAAGSATVTASAQGRSASASITVVDPSPPEAPTGLTAAPASHTEVELNWSDASDNETGFEVQREAVGDGQGPPGFTTVTTVGAGVTTFTDTGLEPATAYRWRVRATNANGTSGFAGPAEATTFAVLALETQALPTGVLNQPYQAALAASGGGGEGSFAWSLSGTLPTGMSFSEEGVLSGTPGETGTFSLEITVASGGQSATRTLELRVNQEATPPQVVTTELAEATVGVAYTAVLEASGGDGIYSWSLVSGSWPEGLALASDGTVSGTPTQEGEATVTVQVSSAGETATGEVSVAVTAQALQITTEALPDGRVDAGYQEELLFSGGAPPVTWSVEEGSPPPGLALSEDGVLSGTPSQAGSFSFRVRVTDTLSAVDTATFQLQVDPAPVAVLARDMDGGQVGTPYSLQFEAQGGDGLGFTWTLAGAPPPGLTLGADGVLSGTPTSAGTFQFTARAQSAGSSDTETFILTTVPQPREGYQVDLVYLTTVSPAVRAVFESAQARWSEIITADEADEVGGVPGCGRFHPATQATIDDVYIYVEVEPIDGEGGTLGQASPCYIRSGGSFKSLTGLMRFDQADVQNLLSNNLLDLVILHEMGHVLGIGVFWDNLDLQLGECLVDPIFTGERAIQAFNDADGTLYSGQPVPIHNGGSLNDGSNCSHWREGVMGPELMTPFLNSGSNPLSAITIESLADMGYTVDPEVADSYVLPKPVPVGAPALREGVHLGDDVISIPLRTVEPDGTPRLLRRPR